MTDNQKNGPFKLGPNWPVVLVAFYGCCLHSGGLIYAFSLFVNPLQADFGWDRTAIMMAFTMQLVSLGLVSPLVGRGVDHYGAKTVISIGALVAAAGFMTLPFMKTLAHFYIGNIIAGLGSAAMGPVPLSAAVTENFDENRGLAVGFMSTGVGVGGFVTAPLIGGLLIPRFGWRISYACIAAITLTMIPLVLLFLKKEKQNRPKEGQLQGQAISGPEGSTTAIGGEFWSMRFICLAAGFFMFLFSVVGALQSQVPHFREIGFPLLTASSILGVSALVSAGAKFSFGWLCDRYHPKAMYVVGALFLTTGLLLLKQITPESSTVLIWAFAVILGVGVGSWLPIMSMMVSRMFALSAYGTVFGAMSMVQQVGTALGPLAAGFIFDTTGNYQGVFNLYLAVTLCSILSIIASGITLKGRPVPRTTAEEIVR